MNRAPMTLLITPKKGISRAMNLHPFSSSFPFLPLSMSRTHNVPEKENYWNSDQHADPEWPASVQHGQAWSLSAASNTCSPGQQRGALVVHAQELLPEEEQGHHKQAEGHQLQHTALSEAASPAACLTNKQDAHLVQDHEDDGDVSGCALVDSGQCIALLEQVVSVVHCSRGSGCQLSLDNPHKCQCLLDYRA